MVLMSSFFVCIKMTLLLFYKRLFLITHPGLRIFWWANFVYIILWFVGSTGFYLLQCLPVGWYYLQYYARFHKSVPGGMSGQCDATTVQHVAMPLIFSLISDVALLALPIWAISKLRLDRKRKMGLMGVFGIGLIACMLELARILDLVIDTDDKTDPSCKKSHRPAHNFLSLGVCVIDTCCVGGVAMFLMLTAAEETTAVVCACLPVIGPQLYKKFRVKLGSSYAYGKNGGRSSEGHSGRGRPSGSQSWRNKHNFLRVPSMNHIPTSLAAGTVDVAGGDDNIYLASLDPTHRGGSPSGIANNGQSPYIHHLSGRPEDSGGWYQHFPAEISAQPTQPGDPVPSSPRDIHVRTDIELEVGYKTDFPVH